MVECSSGASAIKSQLAIHKIGKADGFQHVSHTLPVAHYLPYVDVHGSAVHRSSWVTNWKTTGDGTTGAWHNTTRQSSSSQKQTQPFVASPHKGTSGRLGSYRDPPMKGMVRSSTLSASQRSWRCQRSAAGKASTNVAASFKKAKER